MKAGSSRRDFICRGLFGAAITGLLSRVASTSAKTESRWVDRRQLGRIGTDVSILGLGLGAAFMDGYERNLDAGHAFLESALALGINCWDTARVTVPAKEWLLPVLSRNRFDPDAVLTIYPCTRPDKGRYEDELLPLARARKMGVIAMKTNPIRASGEPAPFTR